MAGAAAFLLLCLFKAWRTQHRLSRTRRAANTDLQAEVAQLAARLGVGMVPKIWLVDGISQPFVWGLLRGGIYLPANFEQVCQADDLRGILMHELAHVSRWDAAINALQVLVQGAFFFHPLVWWANRKVRQEREKCCDEVAIASLSAKPKQYGRAIVDILVNEYESSQPVPSLAVAGPIKNVEDRIKTMMSPNIKFYKRPTWLAVISVLIVAALAIPTALTLTARAKSKPEPATEPGDLLTAEVELIEADEIKGRYTWRVNRDAPSRMIYGFHSISDTGKMEFIADAKDGIARKNVKNFSLEFCREESNLHLAVADTFFPPESGGKGRFYDRTLWPQNTIFKTTYMARAGNLSNARYVTLWRGDFIREERVVKSILFGARLAAQDDPVRRMLDADDPVQALKPLGISAVSKWPSGPLTFGPVIERVISQDVKSHTAYLDLDTDTYTEFENLPATSEMVRKAGVDIHYELMAGSKEMRLTTSLQPLLKTGWNSDPEHVRRALLVASPSVLPQTAKSIRAFQTREGGMGILQIVGFTENPKGVKIRYKMVQSAQAGKAEIPWGEPVEGVQVRLRAEKKLWKLGETPILMADVRNRSKFQLRVWSGQIYGWELDVNGQWYEYPRHTGMAHECDPGQQLSDLEITLSSKGNDVPWFVKTDPPAFPDNWIPLALPVGKHKVRVAVLAPRRQGDKDFPAIRVVSNPVENTVEHALPGSGLSIEELVKTKAAFAAVCEAVDEPSLIAVLVARGAPEPLSQEFKVVEVLFGKVEAVDRTSLIYKPEHRERAIRNHERVIWIGHTRNMNSHGSLYGLKALPDTPENRQAVKAAASWGEAVEGVQVRLRAEKAVWQAGEWPKFWVDLRNHGKRTLQRGGGPGLCRVELDGVLYYDARAFSLAYVGKSFSSFIPGPLPGQQQNNVLVPLIRNRRWESRDQKSILEFKPDSKHAIRVALVLRFGDGQRIEVFSNPVEIEIQPAKR